MNKRSVSHPFRLFLGSVATVCLLVFPSSTPTLAGPLPGDHEIQVSGGLFHRQGEDTGSLNVDLVYGYYLTPGWQLGLRQALNYDFIEDRRDVWTATTTPFVTYNFRLTDSVLPYLGGFIGLVWNDRDVTGTVGPQAGIKFFFSPQTFIGLGYRYEWFFNRIDAIDKNANRGNHVFNLGFGFAWGGSGTRK